MRELIKNDDLMTQVGAVVIGRNEGERLRRCIASLRLVHNTVYVDSGSTDGSAEWVADMGLDVIELNALLPFTAARARNSGFRRLRTLYPDIAYVQFVDGDCEVKDGWPGLAVEFLSIHTDIGAVSGALRERHPDQSIYNWLCDQGWNSPPGETRSFGGIVMMRVDAFESVGGFRDDMIAGEEPELAVRLRTAGWRVWQLEHDMATHDAAIFSFNQWWLRTVRTGYAFAQGAHLQGNSPDRHWVWESRRAWMWGLWLPLGCLGSGLTLGPWGWAAFIIYPLQLIRQARRNTGSVKQRATLALFQLLSRFPEAIGELKYMRDRLLGHRSQIIEYR